MLLNRDRGKTKTGFFALYPRDWQRLTTLREIVSEQTGRPCSASIAIIFMLDRFDEMRKIDELIKVETKIAKKAKRKRKV